MAELDTMYRPPVEQTTTAPECIEQSAGADWGNGNPAPSVIDSAEDGGLLWDESRSRKPTLVVEAQSVDDAGTARELVPGIDLDEAGSGDATIPHLRAERIGCRDPSFLGKFPPNHPMAFTDLSLTVN